MSTSLIFTQNPDAREAFDGSFWTIQEAFPWADPLDGGSPLFPPPTKPGLSGG